MNISLYCKQFMRQEKYSLLNDIFRYVLCTILLTNLMFLLQNKKNKQTNHSFQGLFWVPPKNFDTISVSLIVFCILFRYLSIYSFKEKKNKGEKNLQEIFIVSAICIQDISVATINKCVFYSITFVRIQDVTEKFFRFLQISQCYLSLDQTFKENGALKSHGILRI